MATAARFLIGILLVVLVGQPLLNPGAARADNLYDEQAAMRVFALVNQWRIEEGQWPLKLNPILQQMAQGQAMDIYPILSQITTYEEYHRDSQGRDPFQRAVKGYNWPTYGRIDQIQVGENAAEFSPAKAVNFWQNSPIHKKTALNPGFREAGVAAMPLKVKGSYLFIIVFGARPEVWPALVTATGDGLYLTNESSRYSSLKPQLTQVRLYNANREPLTDLQPWQPILKLPAGVQGKVAVYYKNSKTEVWTDVDLAQDIAILPESLKTTKAPASAQQPTAISPTTVPARAAFPTNTPRAVSVAARPVDAAQPTAMPTIAPTATLARTAAPSADLTLFYGTRSLVVYNSSGKPLDLTPFKVGKVTADRWTKVAPFPVKAFPAGQCLSIVLMGAENEATPSQCKAVRSQISLSQTFWLQGPFTVSYNDAVVKTCDPDTTRCEVDLRVTRSG